MSSATGLYLCKGGQLWLIACFPPPTLSWLAVTETTKGTYNYSAVEICALQSWDKLVLPSAFKQTQAWPEVGPLLLKATDNRK